MGEWISKLIGIAPVVATAVVQMVLWPRLRKTGRTGWELAREEGESATDAQNLVLGRSATVISTSGPAGTGKSQILSDGFEFPLGASDRLVFFSARLLEGLTPEQRGAPPDLFKVAEDRDAISGVVRLHEGFDALFRALGPPPDGGLNELESLGSGGGGEAQ
ncbi:hypothetical protein ACTPOK_29445 [Streptomyces inhibens]|uniref:hypothetical protein n=1 Tax=Streptomyces inhibens TaxID=2293571 RepID=UPI00402A81C0